MPWQVPITVDGLEYPVTFNTEEQPTQQDLDEAVQQILSQRGQAPQPAQPAGETPGYLSQLGSALGLGYRQMKSGVGATFNALTGDTEDVAAEMAEQAKLQREQQAAQTPQDIEFMRRLDEAEKAYELARGPVETISALSQYPAAAFAEPGAAFKTAVQSAPNVLISGATSLAGYGLGGLVGGAATLETGPGAILGGIAGAAAGGALSNTLMEAGPSIFDALNEKTNGAAANMTAEQISAFLKANPDVIEQGLKTGAIRGSVIGAVEALGVKGSGRLLTMPERAAARAAQKTLVDAGVDVTSKKAVDAALLDPTIRSATKTAAEAAKNQFSSAGNLARMAGASAIETGAAGAGELAAQAAAGQDISTKEAFMEMLGEAALSAPMAAATKAVEGAKYALTPSQEAEQPEATQAEPTVVPIAEEPPSMLPFTREDIRATQLPFGREDIRSTELPFTREDIRATQLPFGREDIRATELPFSRQNIRGLSMIQPEIAIAQNAIAATQNVPFTDITDKAATNIVQENARIASQLAVSTEQATEEAEIEVTPSPAMEMPSPPQGVDMASASVSPIITGAPIQPVETQEDATIQRKIPENRVEERVQIDEGRPTAEAGGGDRPVVSGQIQEEVISSPKRQAVESVLNAIQGHLANGGDFQIPGNPPLRITKKNANQFSISSDGDLMFTRGKKGGIIPITDVAVIGSQVGAPFDVLSLFEEAQTERPKVSESLAIAESDNGASFDRLSALIGDRQKAADEIETLTGKDVFSAWPIVVDAVADSVSVSNGQFVDTDAKAEKLRSLYREAQEMPASKERADAIEQITLASNINQSNRDSIKRKKITPPGEPTTATEGMVTPGGVAPERDLLKPYANIAVPDLEKLSPQDWGRRRDYLEGKRRNNQQEKAELLKTQKQNWESREYNENARINEVAASLRAAIQDMQLARPDLEAEFRKKSGAQTEGGGDAEVVRRAEGEMGSATVDTRRGDGELRREPEALQRVSEQPQITTNLGDTTSGGGEVQPDNRIIDVPLLDASPDIVLNSWNQNVSPPNSLYQVGIISIRDIGTQEPQFSTTKTVAGARPKTGTFRDYIIRKQGWIAGRYLKAGKRPSKIYAEAVDSNKLKLPSGYTRQGDLYVFQPQTTAAEKQTPVPLRGGTGAAGVASSSLGGGRSPELTQVSPETETTSTEKSPVTKPSEVTLSIAKRFGGRIAWSQGDLAIIEAFQLFGSKSLYIAVVGDRYSMTDFTLMKPEQRKALLGDNEELFLRKREEIVEENNRMLAENPDGPFTNGQTIVVSKNVPQNVASVFREWVRLLGLNAPTRIVLTTPQDGIDMAAKYGGKFRRIGVTSLMSDNERGQMTPLGQDDFHIFYKEDASYARIFETLAHELGHILERQAFKNLPEDQRRAIISEHEKWLKRVGSQKALDGIRELRAMRVGRIQPNVDRADERFEELNAYWKSFSEWFADQVSRWATTTEKPLTVVEKFFARLGKKLREFFNLKGGQFAPNQKVAEWLDSLSPDFNSVVEATFSKAETETQPSGNLSTAEAAMSYLMDDLTDAQKAKWTPEMFAAAKTYFDGGGKDFESLQKVVKFPRVVSQAYLKADKAASEEQARIDKAQRATDAEIAKAEREEKKLEAEMLKREEMRSKAIDSLIGASEKKKRKFGQVTNSDAIAAVAMLVSSKDVPGVLTTWVGTKEDFLRDPANQLADPEIYARIKAGELVEGFFNKGRAYVFLDGVGVSENDMLRGEQMDVSPQIAAVRRVLLHESLVHRGIHGLPLRHRRLILNWVRQNSTPAELDDLAKLYTEYANWRDSEFQFEALAEELLAKKVDSLTEIPKDGPMAKLMDILRQIWDFIVGYKREPTLSDLKSVVKLLKSGAEALTNDTLKDGGGVKLSMGQPEFTSETSAAFTAGSEAARFTLYSERDMDIREAIRRAYEAMPKQNSVAVPIGELFAKTEELMPGVTQEEFSLVLQDLFEDNGAVLQEGDSEFIVTTPEGRRAGFVVVMPRAAKASKIPIEDAVDVSKSFKADLAEAGRGRVDTKAKFKGKLLKDTEIPEHNVKSYPLYRNGAIKLIDDLMAKTNDILAVAESLQDPEFQMAVGLQVSNDVSSEMITIARSQIGFDIGRRLTDAIKNEKNPRRKRELELAKKKGIIYYNAGTGAGQALQNRQESMDDPLYKGQIIFDQAELQKDKKAKEKLDAITGGTEKITDIITGAEQKAAEETTQAEVEAQESAAEDDEYAKLVSEGEAELTNEEKGLWERAKMLLRRFAMYAKRKGARAANAAKASLSAEQRKELDELNAIMQMSDEEAAKAESKDRAEFAAVLKKLLGEEKPNDTPQQKKTRQKRVKMIDVVRRYAESGKPIDLSDQQTALKGMLREMNKARPADSVPLERAMPWRKILSSKPKDVAEYRQRILEAVSSIESFQNLTEEQKERLADLYAEAWEERRQAILDRMLRDEIKKARDRDEVSDDVEKKLQQSRNKILEIINLGGFNNDDLVKILGERYGISTSFTEEQKARIQKLADQLQDEDMNTAKRNKLAMEFAVELAGAMDVPVTEIIANWWTSSVLFGPQTIFSIGAAFLNGGYSITTIGTRRMLAKLFKGDVQGSLEESILMLKGIARYLGAFKQAGRRAWNYLWSGDVGLLGIGSNDILSEISNFEQLQRFQRHKLLAEQLAKDPKRVRRYVGIYLRFVSRLLTALDAFNVMVTKAGTASLALRMSGMSTENIIKAEKMLNLKAYKDQVIRDYFDNKAPKTEAEKAIVDSYAEAEMYRAIDKMGGKMENADYLASESAMTMHPTGFGGVIYDAITGFFAQRQANADEYLDKMKKDWVTRKDLTSVTFLALAYLRQFAAYNAAGLTGSKFVRYASNKFNQGLSFIPLAGLLRQLEAKDDRIKGKDAFIETIYRNQVIGALMLFIGGAVLGAIEDEPDDEKRGTFWNGGWANLTPDQKKQLLAKGQKEYTMGFKYNGRWYVFNYQNWPLNQMLSAIGSMSDQIRFSPKQWNEKSLLSKTVAGMVSGVKSTLEIPALSGLQELVGNRLASKDPTEQSLDRISRVASGWVGGFVPRILKDIDFATQPELRKYETLWEKTASHIPIYRRYVGEEYYDILGKPIKRNVIPGSREFMMGPTEPEYKILGALNSRNIFLTPANAEYRMVGKGRNRRRLTQEEADAYSLETGKGYRQMLLRYGQRALQMPTERARAFLSDKADEVRDRALKKVYRGYTK